jgi:hypothetical protein
MPADTNLILTQNHVFSYLSTSIHASGIMFSTPSVNLQGPGGGVGTLVCRIFVPAFTNADPVTPGVGAFSAGTIRAILQVAAGNPATEANWRNHVTFRDLTPRVPNGGTGAGTPQQPIFSNVAIVRFACVETNVRLTGTVSGSFANFSFLHVAIYKGDRGGPQDDISNM